MPLVNAKCTNCGGTLTVDASKEAAICDFCGSPYIVEKAIQNYNYYVTQNIKADNVNVTAKGEAEKERLLHNAETYTGFKDYKKALEIYKQVTEDYPDDYRGWYNLASIETDEFKKVDVSAQEFKTYCEYMDRALMTAPSGKKEKFQQEWEAYLSNHWSFLEEKKKELCELQNIADELQSKIDELKNQINISNEIISNNQVSYIPSSKHKKSLFWPAFIIVTLLVIAVAVLGLLGVL